MSRGTLHFVAWLQAVPPGVGRMCVIHCRWNPVVTGLFLLLFSCCQQFLAANLLRAANRSDNEPPRAEARLLAETLESGIQQLDSGVYSERRAASQLLSSLGKDAIPALSEVAISGSTEASRRAIEILARHAASRQADLQEVANAALEMIANAGPPGAAMAAKSSLRQTPNGPNGAAALRGIRVNVRNVPVGGAPAGALPALPGLPAAGAPRPGAAGLPNGAIPPAKRAVRRTVRTENNGVRIYDTDDGVQHVKISEHPDGNLEVETTVQRATGAETRQFRAKNLAEMKQHHAEAGQLYETFGPQWNLQAAGGNAGDARQALLRVQTFLDDRIERTKHALRITDNPAHADRLRKELDRYAEQKQRYQELERQWRGQE